MSLSCVSLFVFLCSVVGYTSANGIRLLFINNGSCSLLLNELNQFDSYQLNWDGRALSSNCKLRFTGKSFISSEARDRYKVCVKALRYDVTDCTFRMTYCSGKNGGPVEEHLCGNLQPSRFCAGEGDTLSISLSTTAASNSSFQLMVTAEKTYTHPEENIYLVYSVVCGLSLLCLLMSSIIVLVICKKHKQTERCVNHTTTDVYNTPMPSGTVFPSGVYNEGYVNTEQDSFSNGIAVRLPEYSEKEDKVNPPPYTEVNDQATKT
ncbi:uncharacterized protein LOC132558594 [Ylistrum balloti]|uniref:uncharacterized protein LOC132558594 n=1 Tax=Ylistrum balloti TaxID=509963 RepID=UPI002905D834|nr:uncharacterized protein LOC132558594 [Ylistrum balloti]